MDKTILHCDLNGFYASVECLSRPELLEVPMAVSGNPAHRHGIILAKNELAKRCGVVTAETIWQAKKKCPNLVLVQPHHDKYYEYSEKANEIYERFTDRVEPFGIDESWLDVTGCTHLFGNGKEIADQIREEIKSQLGLTVSVGVSFNKVFAKLGSDYKKPDATTVISRENYKEIIYPLPVSDLLYVGKAATEALAKYGITTIGQLANFEKPIIAANLGKLGEMIHDYANGLDNNPVGFAHDAQNAKSIGNGMTFRRDLDGMDDMLLGLSPLVDSVATRLRKSGMKCSTVQIVILDPQFKSISRQKKLEKPTNLYKEIRDKAIEIIQSSWNLKAPIRMLTITAMNLVAENEAEQISFLGDVEGKRREKLERIEKTVDTIRNRFGKKAISFGAEAESDIGVSEHND
jgi:DNA polymerase-4